jgi:hypothetical protein
MEDICYEARRARPGPGLVKDSRPGPGRVTVGTSLTALQTNLIVVYYYRTYYKDVRVGGVG